MLENLEFSFLMKIISNAIFLGGRYTQHIQMRKKTDMWISVSQSRCDTVSVEGKEKLLNNNSINVAIVFCYDDRNEIILIKHVNTESSSFIQQSNR